MSRSFEKLEGSDLLLVVDMQHGVHRGTGERSSIEYAMSLAASITVQALAGGQNLALLCNDAANTSIPAARGGPQLRRVLDFLAVASADGALPLERLLLRLAAGTGQQSLVLVTPRSHGEWVDRVVALGRGMGAQSTVLHLSTPRALGAERRSPPAAWLRPCAATASACAGTPSRLTACSLAASRSPVRLPVGTAEAVA